MNTIIIGQNGSGKTEHIKERIEKLQKENKMVVIIDLKNQYKNIGDITVVLDNLSPLLSPLSLSDMKVLNAGYEKKSNLLYKKAEELLKGYQNDYPMYKGLPFDEIEDNFKRTRLIEEVIERLSFSHGHTEKAWGELFTENVPQRKLKKHIAIERVIDVIKEKKVVRLTKLKNIQANHLRAVIFFLLHRLSLEKTEEFYVVADEMSSLLNKGNTKLFLETVKLDFIKFIISFNKTTDIPIEFVPITDRYYIHKIQDKQELKKLELMGFEVKEEMKKIAKGNYIEFEKGWVI